MEHLDTVVIGAGVSGLAAAAFRGERATVFERDSSIGGYCKTIKQDGFVWDYSGHFFHFRVPWVEAWLRERMAGQDIRKVAKRSFISYGGARLDFPFQSNIHQLPLPEFLECLHDVYFAQRAAPAAGPPANFKEMLMRRFGNGICEKFLIPYNEKLYATDLGRLDPDAMGRFFPKAQLDDIVRSMRSAADTTYNSTFIYPAGGAIEFVNAIASRLRPGAVFLDEGIEEIQLEARVVRTSRGRELGFRHLISSAPLPSLLRAARLSVDDTWTCNQVLVFNLGFDSKGPDDIHWLYVPSPERVFYRVGFYDNIFATARMSLYVEIGLRQGEQPDVPALRARVLKDLAAEGIVTTQKLVSEHAVIMNPAYVHLTARSNAEVVRLRAELAHHGVHSIGRYGGWTYCSIEDNILEAKEVTDALGD